MSLISVVYLVVALLVLLTFIYERIFHPSYKFSWKLAIAFILFWPIIAGWIVLEIILESLE